MPDTESVDMSQDDDEKAIVQSVNDRYGSVAINASENQGAAYSHHKIATTFGYTEAELQAIPDGANLGLSCGNPIVLANLREARALNSTRIEAFNAKWVVRTSS